MYEFHFLNCFIELYQLFDDILIYLDSHVNIISPLFVTSLAASGATIHGHDV